MIFIDAIHFLQDGFAIRRECWAPRVHIDPHQPFFTFSTLDIHANDWLYLDPQKGWVR